MTSSLSPIASKPAAIGPIRQWWVLFHRWVGLVMAGFLLIAGITGALVTWNHELDTWFARDLYRVPAPPHTARLSPLVLRDKVAAAYPQARINYLDLKLPPPGEAALLYLRPVDFTQEPLENDEVFVDPVTGNITGARKAAAISQGMKNLMPFIYSLHYELALGTIGNYVFGIIALLWTLDCFVGAYLSMPLRIKKSMKPSSATPKKNWWARWKPSWMVRRQSGSYKLHFDLHRAGGLWTWAMLFVFAWSAVSFNLRQVYTPVMKVFFAFDERENHLPKPLAAQDIPGLTWSNAYRIGQTHMAAEAKRLHFRIIEEQSLSYDADYALYRYYVRSNADIHDTYGSTGVYFNANNGALVMTSLPSGQYAGDTITGWLTTLHMAEIWGLPFRIFVCLMGLVVAMLSVTGVIVWWRKRRGRMHRVIAGTSVG